jgi:hypothetical protein
LKKRREARFRPFFGRASLLSVFGELEDAFKSHLFSSDAPQIPDFFSCLKGESGEENVGSPYVHLVKTLQTGEERNQSTRPDEILPQSR